MRFAHLAPFAVVVLAPTLSTGCAVEVPAQLLLPAATLDLDGARTALEARLCADAASDDCIVLDALDRSDGAPSTPIALPVTFPQHLDVIGLAGGDVTVDVQRWIGRAARLERSAPLVPSRLIRLDDPEGGGALAGLDGLEDDTIDGIGIDAAHIVLSHNSLTFDLPQFDLYVGNGVVVGDDGSVAAADPDQALHVATSEACLGGVEGAAPLFLVDGAVVALREALRGVEPWIELRSAGELPALRAGAGAATLVRPGGLADVAVDLQLLVPVRLNLAVEKP